MADQIYIGNFAKGLKTNPSPFNLDNDAFPTMYNFYSWRGQGKRKRGTIALARLQRQIISVAVPDFNISPWQYGPLALIAGAGNLIVGPWTTNLSTFSNLGFNSSITPGTLHLVVGGFNYTEPTIPDGTLLKNGVPDPLSSINYATGSIFINGGGVGPLTGTFSYFPDLPVLGLEDFVSSASSTKFPLLLAFDPIYSYQINQQFTPFFYSTSFYKRTNNPVIWSNTDDNQFWSINFQSAFWVTNNKPGLHFLNGTYVSGSGTTSITFTFTTGGNPFTTLIDGGSSTRGDVLWFNEWNVPTANITAAPQANPLVLTAANTFSINDKITISGVVGMTQLNTGTFTITAVSGTTITLGNVDATDWGDYISGGIATLNSTNTINGVNGVVANTAGKAAGTYVVTFDAAQTVSGTGIVQMLTNNLPGQDGIRWYDGDPTSETGIPTITGLGWVNFAPPLTGAVVSINDQREAKYYLVGALAILPFKDRLLFFGPQIKSSTGSVIQRPLQDTILWSWNGTPYYNALVPTPPLTLETFDNTAYYVDQTGKGGYLPAGIAQPLVTVNTNEDVLLIGFGGGGKKTRFVYTGNDLQPFLFYLISSEIPSSATFSGISLEQGALEIGQYGITVTTQQQCQRIDMDIPDAVFEIQSLNNGVNRVNAVRDFFREWIYFSYPTGDGSESNGSWKYPSTSFLYNYRDTTWAILRENFTHHGSFRRSTHYTWQTLPFKTWSTWREPWNAGSSTALFPSIIGGNPQGYVLIKGEGTGEALSGYIQNITDDGTGNVKITSVNHCVNSESSVQGTGGDYLSFQGTTIGLVTETLDVNNFVLDILYQTTASITAITLATRAVLTIVFPIPADAPAHNSYFVGQRISIAGVVGTTQLNGNTYTITAVTPETETTNATITLNVDSTLFTPYVSGGTTTLVNYIGIGSYTRLSQPLIQTKQFGQYWEQGKKVRLSVQKYLMDTTSNGQVSVNINLSQDSSTAYNFGRIVPQNNVDNSSLEYTQILYTCPESTNLGLTSANVNLQMPTAANQAQIWHRYNTSLVGDSVQIGITLNDDQMHNLQFSTDEIVLQGIHLTLHPSSQLA